MNRRTKSLILSLFSFFIAAVFVFYVKGVQIRDVFDGVHRLTLGEIVLVITLGIFMSLAVFAGTYKKLAFLRKPLWGYKLTSEGYEDTSIEKHPKAVLVLTIIIALSFIAGSLVVYGSKPKESLLMIGIAIFFILVMALRIKAKKISDSKEIITTQHTVY